MSHLGTYSNEARCSDINRLFSCYSLIWLTLFIGLFLCPADLHLVKTAAAQQNPGEFVLEDPEPVIERDPQPSSDETIEQRLSAIFEAFGALDSVSIIVDDGVVTLSGSVANEGDAEMALELAIRVEGVVTVRDELERTLDVADNLSPILTQYEDDLRQFAKALPLYGTAFVIFCVVLLFGHALSAMKWFWRMLTPNPFLAEILSQAVRFSFLLVAVFVVLNIIGATALMAALLGGAGVIGLAIGFAVRDTLENYISSIMLSLRQPFRGGDHVIIGDQEGVVSRLTTRATILKTLDGNHLRIPNADVFKSNILNYTTNPLRRFEFKLGVDAADDPVAAINCGNGAVRSLDFVLNDPPSFAMIESVGDSSIILVFYAWIDQRETDFAKGRSMAIRATKDALEANEFTLPEPIYRLRFDSPPGETDLNEQLSQAQPKTKPKRQPRPEVDQLLDTQPEVDSVRETIVRDLDGAEENLLDDRRPSE